MLELFACSKVQFASFACFSTGCIQELTNENAKNRQGSSDVLQKYIWQAQVEEKNSILDPLRFSLPGLNDSTTLYKYHSCVDVFRHKHPHL